MSLKYLHKWLKTKLSQNMYPQLYSSKKANKTTGIKEIFKNDISKFVFRMGRVILCQIKPAIP